MTASQSQTVIRSLQHLKAYNHSVLGFPSKNPMTACEPSGVGSNLAVPAMECSCKHPLSNLPVPIVWLLIYFNFVESPRHTIQVCITLTFPYCLVMSFSLLKRRLMTWELSKRFSTSWLAMAHPAPDSHWRHSVTHHWTHKWVWNRKWALVQQIVKLWTRQNPVRQIALSDTEGN